jgi:hypothetical protein
VSILLYSTLLPSEYTSTRREISLLRHASVRGEVRRAQAQAGLFGHVATGG